MVLKAQHDGLELPLSASVREVVTHLDEVAPQRAGLAQRLGLEGPRVMIGGLSVRRAERWLVALELAQADLARDRVQAVPAVLVIEEEAVDEPPPESATVSFGRELCVDGVSVEALAVHGEVAQELLHRSVELGQSAGEQLSLELVEQLGRDLAITDLPRLGFNPNEHVERVGLDAGDEHAQGAWVVAEPAHHVGAVRGRHLGFAPGFDEQIVEQRPRPGRIERERRPHLYVLRPPLGRVQTPAREQQQAPAPIALCEALEKLFDRTDQGALRTAERALELVDGEHHLVAHGELEGVHKAVTQVDRLRKLGPPCRCELTGRVEQQVGEPVLLPFREVDVRVRDLQVRAQVASHAGLAHARKALHDADGRPLGEPCAPEPFQELAVAQAVKGIRRIGHVPPSPGQGSRGQTTLVVKEPRRRPAQARQREAARRCLPARRHLLSAPLPVAPRAAHLPPQRRFRCPEDAHLHGGDHRGRWYCQLPREAAQGLPWSCIRPRGDRRG
ncbi:hypothetical protein [Sorangium sp. So ce1151]|uniref:hypothetical protein n=1 Tax=Sorangium sp. So ce1151 TaxID=3133332 RepID=UPI003F6470FE